MGWRVLLPVAGLAATVASLAGVSTSNHRSKSPAQTRVTHKWKIEIDEISASLPCTGNYGDGQKQVTFGWKVDLNEEEKDQLLKRGPVTKEVQVFLRNDKGDNLWPKEWTGIRVLRNQYGGSLSVTYVHQKEQGAVGSILTFDRSSLETTKFICSWNELKKDREIELIRLGAQFGNYQYFRSGQENKMSSNIRLDDCTNYKDGKKAECNLKVTTEGTDLDWSNKVTAKAKLSFE